MALTKAVVSFRQLNQATQIRLLFGLGLGLFIFIFIVWPAWFKRPGIHKQVEFLQQQIGLAQAQTQAEGKLLEERRGYETFIKEVQGDLLPEETKGQLLGFLAQMGEASRVKIIATQPAEEKLGGRFQEKYRSVSYAITVEGGYHELADFVSRIESYPNTLRVNELSIRSQPDTQTKHLGEIRISGFVMRGEGT